MKITLQYTLPSSVEKTAQGTTFSMLSFTAITKMHSVFTSTHESLAKKIKTVLSSETVLILKG